MKKIIHQNQSNGISKHSSKITIFTLCTLGILFSFFLFTTSHDAFAVKPPETFVANIGPDNQVIPISDIHTWNNSDARGYATFTVNSDMTELSYKITMDNLPNVVGIHIHDGKVSENNHVHLVDIKPTDQNDPIDLNPGTLEGVITTGDLCPGHGTITDCSVYGLVYEIINHRAYLNFHTFDGDANTPHGPGDLFTPGEARGQIYPLHTTRVFEVDATASQIILPSSISNSEHWESSNAQATGRFVLSEDGNHLHYTITGKHLPNVVGIHIHQGGKWINNHIHLVDLIPTDHNNPRQLVPGTVTGMISNEDMCPGAHAGHGGNGGPAYECSIQGLIRAFTDHQAYLNIHTNSDADPNTTNGPGDLYTPGEARGQIYPVAECEDCVVNKKNNVLTLFHFETPDNPFLAKSGTFMIQPNPFVHNVGLDYIDTQKFGTGLILSDNDQLDSDPMNGVVELLGVNPGTYSVFSLQGPAGFIKTGEFYSSGEVSANSYPFIYITNHFLDASTLTEPLELDAPIVPESNINTMSGYSAKVNGLTLTSPDQIPPPKMASKSTKYAGTPPAHIEFGNQIDSNLNAQTKFTTLGIPSYDAPSSTADSTLFTPPVFTGTQSNGAKSVLSPKIKNVQQGTSIMLRLDNANTQTSDGNSIAGISLPLDVSADEIGIDLTLHNSPPSGFTAFSEATPRLFLDLKTTGDIDFSDPSSFSENPTIDFRMNKNADGSCPDDAFVYLLDVNAVPPHYEPVAPSPSLNHALNTASLCGYTQELQHFSSYVVGTGGSDDHDHDNHDHGGNGHSHSHSHGASGSSGIGGDDAGTGTSLGYYIEDGVEGFRYTQNPDTPLPATSIEDVQTLEQEIVEFAGKIKEPESVSTEEFNFGTTQPKQEFSFGGRLNYATLTVLSPETQDFGFNFGDDFTGVRMIMEVQDQRFPIKYSANGDLRTINVNKESKSVTFYLQNILEGEMTLSVPRSLIDAEGNNFVLMVTASPERQVDYKILYSDDEYVTLAFSLPENAKTLTIIGTKVVPEFGAITMPLLALALLSIFLFAKKYKMLNGVFTK